MTQTFTLRLDCGGLAGAVVQRNRVNQQREEESISKQLAFSSNCNQATVLRYDKELVEMLKFLNKVDLISDTRKANI